MRAQSRPEIEVALTLERHIHRITRSDDSRSNGSRRLDIPLWRHTIRRAELTGAATAERETILRRTILRAAVLAAVLLLWPAASALASVWFKWTAPFSSPVSFSTNGSGIDTVLSVYTAPVPSPSFSDLRLVAGNDDCQSANQGQSSCLSFDAVAGTTYWIAVDEGATL